MTDVPHNHILQGAPLPLFLRQALPTLISLLAVSSATIVDALFIGNILGSTALAAVSLLTPLLTLIFGLALMFGIGGSVRAGRLLGAGERELARGVFTLTLIGVMVLALGIVTAGWIFKWPLLRLLGGEGQVLTLMNDYYRVLLPFFLVKVLVMVLYFFVRLDGQQHLVAISFIAGAIGNMLLNYLFLVVLEGGISAAAWATGIAQSLSALLLLLYFRSRHARLLPGGKLPHWRALISYGWNGMSEFVNEASTGITALTLNWLLLLRLGVESVAGIAIFYAVFQIALMIFFAIAHASQTLISQNDGAQLDGRVRQFQRLALLSALFCGLLCALVSSLLAPQLAGLFLGAESEAARILGAGFLRQLWPVFICAGMSIVIAACLTALHRPLPSAIISFTRSLALPVLLLVLLYLWLPGTTFLHALNLAEIMTLVLAGVLLMKARRQSVLD